MAIHRIPDISDRENARLEPVPIGTYIAMVFRVTGYDRDCDGSLMARLENVNADGEETGWETNCHGLYPGTDWVLDGPGDLDEITGGDSGG